MFSTRVSAFQDNLCLRTCCSRLTLPIRPQRKQPALQFLLFEHLIKSLFFFITAVLKQNIRVSPATEHVQAAAYRLIKTFISPALTAERPMFQDFQDSCGVFRFCCLSFTATVKKNLNISFDAPSTQTSLSIKTK